MTLIFYCGHTVYVAVYVYILHDSFVAVVLNIAFQYRRTLMSKENFAWKAVHVTSSFYDPLLSFRIPHHCAPRRVV